MESVADFFIKKRRLMQHWQDSLHLFDGLGFSTHFRGCGLKMPFAPFFMPICEMPGTKKQLSVASDSCLSFRAKII